MATPEILPNPTVEAKTADNASKRDIPFSEFFFNKSENPLLILLIENPFESKRRNRPPPIIKISITHSKGAIN